MSKLENYSRKLKWFIPALMVGLVSSCGSGSEGRDPILGTGGAEAKPVTPIDPLLPPPGSVIPGACPVAGPAVTVTDPTNGTQSAATSTTGVVNSGKLITASFSEQMAAASINATSFKLAPTNGDTLVPASVKYDALTKIATLTTSSALLANTAYTAVIQAPITNGTGTPLGCNYAWTFKTAQKPVVTPPSSFLGPLLDPFAIASAGGIFNVGATKINGDVVLSPNQFCNAVAVGEGNDFGLCGGDPANVISNNSGDKVITPTFPDTTSANAVMAALLAKWNSLSPAATPGATVLGCGTIGTSGEAGAGIGCSANATLSPGTYISATNSTIVVDGALTLNGGPDDVWIFQAPSALTTAVNSQILLTGGAKASNVFWYVGSSATLNGGTAFKGNVLASASITTGTLATSCGRLLAGAETAGQFNFLGNTVSVPGHPNAPADCQ